MRTGSLHFLQAVNIGHPGSMTTVHADRPERPSEQIAPLVLQSGTRLRREGGLDYVRIGPDRRWVNTRTFCCNRP